VHPYRNNAPPAADPVDGDTVLRPTGLLVAAILEGATALQIAWKAPNTLKNFEELFKGFGADLPRSTMFALRSEPLWYLVAALGLAQLIWVIIRQRVSPIEHRWMKLSVRVYGILLGLLVAFTIYALYVPIFKLGAVV
jgi:hypothetical protein